MADPDDTEIILTDEAIDELFNSVDDAMEELRLFRIEIFWREHYIWFKEKGYLLRPRYHPDWIASWKTGENGFLCEDGQVGNSLDAIMSATRMSDGAQIILKKLRSSPTSKKEIELYQFFSNADRISDPKNHCVQVLDVLSLPEEKLEFVVFPFLSYWDQPRFETIGEAVEFFRQMFEGLEFMHSLNMTHNDIKWDNVMMDSTPLYDEPVHPVNHTMNRDFTRPAKPHPRTVRPVKYYYIDLGDARHYNPEEGSPQLTVPYGGDRTVPEFKTQKFCDPFAVDVYRVGNIIRQQFTEKNPICDFSKYGFGFMRPLLRDMCQDDPTKRPTMKEVVTRFEGIIKSLNSWKLRSRVSEKATENWILRIYYLPGHWARQAAQIWRRTPSVPRYH